MDTNGILSDIVRKIAELSRRVDSIDAREYTTAGGSTHWKRLLDGYIDWAYHFDGDSIPSEFQWAGSPFITPSIATVQDSYLKIAGGAVGRAFLYVSSINTGTKKIMVELNTNAQDRIGLRLDDGTDNNYVEYYVAVDNASGNKWVTAVRHREGGGTATTVTDRYFDLPIRILLALQITGSPWSSWSVSQQFMSLPGFGARMWGVANGISGLSWTPARQGIIYESTTTATWRHVKVDAVTSL